MFNNFIYPKINYLTLNFIQKMDATHLHLMLTHFPIIGSLIGALILAYGFFTKNYSIQKVAFVVLIFMAIIAIPVYLTGEGAEETVENLPGVSEGIIHQHEEMAEIAIVFMGILGVMSIINLFALYRQLSFARFITVLSLIISLITFGLYAKTGNLGGQIRHTEIRNTNVTNQNMNTSSENEEEDDD